MTHMCHTCYTKKNSYTNGTSIISYVDWCVACPIVYTNIGSMATSDEEIVLLKGLVCNKSRIRVPLINIDIVVITSSRCYIHLK